MNILIWLVVGGIIGWVASMIMGRNASMGIFWNVIVGIVGSYIGNYRGGFFGLGASLTTVTIPGLGMALLGAVVLLGIVDLVKRGRLRENSHIVI